MLQGVSKFNYDLVFRHPLACRQYLRFSVFDVSATKPTVCSKLFVTNFFATCVFSIGAGVFEQSKTTLEVRKHCGKKCRELKMVTVNF